MQSLLVVTLLATLFVVTHIAMSTTPIRSSLVGRIGASRFVTLYRVVASIQFAALLVYYAAHRFDGLPGLNLAAVPPIRWALITVIGIGGSLVGYADSPFSVRGHNFREPYGDGADHASRLLRRHLSTRRRARASGGPSERYGVLLVTGVTRGGRFAPPGLQVAASRRRGLSAFSRNDVDAAICRNHIGTSAPRLERTPVARIIDRSRGSFGHCEQCISGSWLMTAPLRSEPS
jgi:NnrU protein